jgi:aspartate kinase
LTQGFLAGLPTTTGRHDESPHAHPHDRLRKQDTNEEKGHYLHPRTTMTSMNLCRRETCVLGRGGSDTSGALFAALLHAKRYEIWTDVHGMFTSDPRYVPHARLIKRLDYREAQELAAMGAKVSWMSSIDIYIYHGQVLHPRCIGPVHWANVPVEIRNTNDPAGEKTVIGHSIVTSMHHHRTMPRAKVRSPR